MPDRKVAAVEDSPVTLPRCLATPATKSAESAGHQMEAAGIPPSARRCQAITKLVLVLSPRHPRVAYAGESCRHMADRSDHPLSGEAARIRGGRFNPPDSFPVLYLCTTRPCAAAELRRLGERHGIGMAALLPRGLYGYDMSLDQVIDVGSPATVEHLGLTFEEVVGSSFVVPQQVGEAAHSLGIQAIRVPSATRVDQVLAVFPELLGSGRVVPELVERSATIADM